MGCHPTIAVVIPFFQRERGLLSRALRSIAAQRYPLDRLRVIVVDDESPWPAADELAAHDTPAGLAVDVVRQANGGPGRARNTGLDRIPPGTELVAFLDSDDEWTDDHLPRAVRCLAAGFDVYFSNLHHPGDSVDEYAKAGRIDCSRHPALDADPTLHAYAGDMVHQIAAANVIFIPTLVAKVATVGHVRFQESFRHCGEDYLYFLDLHAAGARFAFSSRSELHRGTGVSLWDSNGWGSDGLARRLLDESRYRRQALRRHARRAETRELLRRQIRDLRSLAVRDALHRLRRGKPVEWDLVWTMLRPSVRVLRRRTPHRAAATPG